MGARVLAGEARWWLSSGLPRRHPDTCCCCCLVSLCVLSRSLPQVTQPQRKPCTCCLTPQVALNAQAFYLVLMMMT